MDELAKWGERPAGLPYKATWVENILTGRVQRAKAHPMWNLVSDVANCLVARGDSDHSEMRSPVDTCRLELREKSLGWAGK